MRLFLIALIVMNGVLGCGGKGEDGAPGATGATGSVGAQGVAGVAGTSQTISSGFFCSKLTGGLGFSYRGIVYSSGDVFLDCSIADSASSYSASLIYKASQTGSTTGFCSVTYDSEAPNDSGYWSFTMNSTKKVVYTNSGASINGTTVTFAGSDCTTF
jgi:hypothetical protein